MQPEEATEISWTDAELPLKRRNGWLIGIFSLLTVGVYAIYWLYRLQRELPTRKGIDIKGSLWLGMFALFTVVMFGFLIASSYGTWTHWSEPTSVQQGLFLAGLGTAIVFNVWFGFGTERLTDRVQHLATNKPPPIIQAGQKIILLFGVFCEMTVMIFPPAVEVGMFESPGWLLFALEFSGRVGTGCLFAWAISIHMATTKLVVDANESPQSAR